MSKIRGLILVAVTIMTTVAYTQDVAAGTSCTGMIVKAEQLIKHSDMLYSEAVVASRKAPIRTAQFITEAQLGLEFVAAAKEAVSNADDEYNKALRVCMDKRSMKTISRGLRVIRDKWGTLFAMKDYLKSEIAATYRDINKQGEETLRKLQEERKTQL